MLSILEVHSPLLRFIILARRAKKSWRELWDYLVSGKNFAPSFSLQWIICNLSPEEQYRYLASELAAIDASPDIDL